MHLSIITTATLAVFAATTAIAAEVEKKNEIAQLKPPIELRINMTTPGLRDSLTIAPTVGTKVILSSPGVPEEPSPQAGVWRSQTEEQSDK